MRDDEVEWDDKKAARNFRDHGVTFEQARMAFDDPDGIEEDEPDPNEKRYKRLCSLGQRVLVVIYTERGNRFRIISARPASEHEQRTYLRQ